MVTEREEVLNAALDAVHAVFSEGVSEVAIVEAIASAVDDLPERNTTALAKEWNALLATTRREILRGIREHGRCDGDWHGRDDLQEASRLAARLLVALTEKP